MGNERSRTSSGGDSYRPSASGLESWRPTKHAHDPADKGRLERPEELDSPRQTQNEEEPRVPAKRAASAGPEAVSPPKRKRVDVQHLRMLRAHLAPANGNSSRKTRRSARLIQKRAVQDSPSDDTRMNNADDHLEGGVRIDNERTSTPEPRAEATSADPPNGDVKQVRTEHSQPKVAWGARHKALFSGSLRAVPTDEQKPPSPPPPPQEPKHYRFASAEHTIKTLFEVIDGYFVNLQESGDWRRHAGLEEAFCCWKERMGASCSKLSLQDPARNHPQNWRIPSDAITYGGWLFKDVPRSFRLYLSYQLGQGRYLKGDWKPLREAFEYYHPYELPGRRARAIARSRSQNTRYTRQPPSSTTNVKRDPDSSPFYRVDPFCIGPEYFTFPNNSPYAYKTLSDLSEQDLQKVVKQLRDRRLGGKVYADLREAFEVLRPDLLSSVGA